MSDEARAGEVIDSLTRIWFRHSQRPVSFGDDVAALRGAMVFALTHHVMRLSRVVRSGTDSGLGVELVPLVRLSLESACTAGWLATDPTSGSAITLASSRQSRTLVREIMRLNPDDPPGPRLAQAEALIEELEGTKGGANFEQRCKTLPGGEQLYVVFRALSQWSHAGVPLADLYVAETASGPVFVLDEPFEPADVMLDLQARMLLLAHASMDSVRDRPWHRKQLEAAARRLGATAWPLGYDLHAG